MATCPVCGYTEMPDYMDDEICPSCGFQFGYTDYACGITQEQWREKWIAEGMPWDGIDIHPPQDWNPRAQLLTIGIKI